MSLVTRRKRFLNARIVCVPASPPDLDCETQVDSNSESLFLKLPLSSACFPPHPGSSGPRAGSGGDGRAGKGQCEEREDNRVSPRAGPHTYTCTCTCTYTHAHARIHAHAAPLPSCRSSARATRAPPPRQLEQSPASRAPTRPTSGPLRVLAASGCSSRHSPMGRGTSAGTSISTAEIAPLAAGRRRLGGLLQRGGYRVQLRRHPTDLAAASCRKLAVGYRAQLAVGYRAQLAAARRRPPATTPRPRHMLAAPRRCAPSPTARSAEVSSAWSGSRRTWPAQSGRWPTTRVKTRPPSQRPAASSRSSPSSPAHRKSTVTWPVMAYT